MADNTLIAEPRTEQGTRPAGRLRRQGRVPAVVYGLGTDSQSITVPGRELQHMLASTGSNTLFTLHLDGGDQLALARQIQRHPVRGTLLHVDFIRVRSDVAVTAEIPVHLEGEAEGAKRGGLLEQALFTLSIEALPQNIPSTITFDVTAMEIGDQAHVSDLVVPPGVTVTNEPDELLVQVVAPRVEEVAEAEAEGAEAAVEGEAPAGGGGGESDSSEG